MIGDAIRLILTNIPVILFVVALAVPALRKSRRAEDYLAWLLLLSIGVQSVWAGVYHVFFPQTAAEFIGWQVSPFQFEIGIADIAVGITAIISFWRPIEFKSAVVTLVAIFFVGLVYGHIHQVILTGDYAAGNAGALLVLTIVNAVLLVWLLAMARRAPAQSAVRAV
ncbi:DUF6790 family protein [Rhizobium sp. BK251]|uniref:DUF6790 family protein n=1 Tax=Rhizobium sp. BK251 TaxID=2512125 RepID=UPI0010538F1C|nr:DUF6790 family protein [Rhizobium sp. BK251]TCL69638.1 hypothetical protein EV286_108211 [Rhizobium sp. BK251]